MNILVIGGSGFLGSHIADALSVSNHSVTIFDIKPSDWASKSQTVIVADISDQLLLESEIKKADVVYHMAGIADIEEAKSDPLQTIAENIMGGANVVSLCAKYSVRLMYGSTIYVYSKHGSFYRASKQAVESLIEVFHEENNLQYTILRFGSLYGPRAQSWNGLTRIVTEMINNKKIEFGGTGSEKREYIHVVDAARMSVELLSSEYLSKAITLTGIQVLTQAELLEMIIEILGMDVSVTYNPDSNRHSHYKLTPYQYVPKSAIKHISSEYVDIGQGILELISELSDASNN